MAIACSASAVAVVISRTQWVVAASAVLIAAVAASPRAARRNWEYLRIARGAVASNRAATETGSGRADEMLRLRAAVSGADWRTAAEIVANDRSADRLPALIVIRDAEQRAQHGDFVAARAAIAAAAVGADRDSDLAYRLGQAYERANAPAEAIAIDLVGAQHDRSAKWSEGRYRAAMIYQRTGQWQSLVDVLAPALSDASDDELARPVQTADPGGALWQGTLLALGEAYEHLGDAANARTAYARLARIAAPRHDWTVNRGLVKFASFERLGGNLHSSAVAIVRALDLAAEFDSSFRSTYELDTAAEAARLVARAEETGRARELAADADQLTQSSTGQCRCLVFARTHGGIDVRPTSCARDDCARHVVRSGSGAYLTGRPAVPVNPQCVAR